MWKLALFGALDALNIYGYYTNAISHLTQLTELHLELCENDIDFEIMVRNLGNLERLVLKGSVGQLSSFLRHSKKLKFVIFTGNINALTLFDLNEVRKLSDMQDKVEIGVPEYQFLRTKWNLPLKKK